MFISDEVGDIVSVVFSFVFAIAFLAFCGSIVIGLLLKVVLRGHPIRISSDSMILRLYRMNSEENLSNVCNYIYVVTPRWIKFPLGMAAIAAVTVLILNAAYTVYSAVPQIKSREWSVEGSLVVLGAIVFIGALLVLPRVAYAVCPGIRER